jgi:hypothetical protein
VLDLIDHRRQFSAQSPIQADAEDLADPVRSEPPQSDFATAFKDLVDGKWRLKMKFRQYSICVIE